jgi:hypothetical protein
MDELVLKRKMNRNRSEAEMDELIDSNNESNERRWTLILRGLSKIGIYLCK